jgi:putative transposase
LGCETGDPAGRGSGNSRGGYSSKTVIGDDGAIEIAMPRDGNGNCGPQIGANGETSRGQIDLGRTGHGRKGWSKIAFCSGVSDW